MKFKLAISAAAFVLGIAAGSWLIPPKEKIVEKEKIVTQYKIRTIEVTTTKPDGTTQTTRETFDDSTVVGTRESVKTLSLQSQWILGLSAGSQIDRIDPIYGVQIHRRLVGPIFAGAYGRSNGEIGFGLAFEF